jgi:hypothetical protein
MFKFLACCFHNLVSFIGWFRDELQHPRKKRCKRKKRKEKKMAQNFKLLLAEVIHFKVGITEN